MEQEGVVNRFEQVQSQMMHQTLLVNSNGQSPLAIQGNVPIDWSGQQYMQVYNGQIVPYSQNYSGISGFQVVNSGRPLQIVGKQFHPYQACTVVGNNAIAKQKSCYLPVQYGVPLNIGQVWTQPSVYVPSQQILPKVQSEAIIPKQAVAIQNQVVPVQQKQNPIKQDQVVKDSFKDDEKPEKPSPPKAIIKPQVLKHVIEGYVIQESSEPFPVDKSVIELSDDEDLDKKSVECDQNVNPSNWTVKEVYEFIKRTPGCEEYAEDFSLQEIDGQALLLLNEAHLMKAMSIKLGPALKICSKIRRLITPTPPANPTPQT